MCMLVSINWSYVFFFITYYSTGYKSCISYFAACDPTSLLRGYISKYKKKNENKCVPVCVICRLIGIAFPNFSFSAGASTFGSDLIETIPLGGVDFEDCPHRDPFSGEASTTGSSSSRPFSAVASSSESGSYSSRLFSHLLRQTDYILDQIQRGWFATWPKTV